MRVRIIEIGGFSAALQSLDFKGGRHSHTQEDIVVHPEVDYIRYSTAVAVSNEDLYALTEEELKGIIVWMEITASYRFWATYYRNCNMGTIGVGHDGDELTNICMFNYEQLRRMVRDVSEREFINTIRDLPYANRLIL